MGIEFSMGDFERIFYALSLYYIHFCLFFHFHKEIIELNVYLTFSIIRAIYLPVCGRKKKYICRFLQWLKLGSNLASFNMTEKT